MKKKPKEPKEPPRLSPIFSEVLGREVPTTKIGTVRINGLVSVSTLAQHEAWRLEVHPPLTSGHLIEQLTSFAVKNGFAAT